MEPEVVAARGTKEIDEAIVALSILAKAGMDIAKDGKINLADIQHAIELVKRYEEIVAGIQGADQIYAEIKDLTLDEAQAIIVKLVSLVAALKAA